MKSSARRESKGFDLLDATSLGKDGDLSFSSGKSLASGMVLVDSHTYLNNATRRFQEEAELQYEKGMKSQPQRTRSFMAGKYDSILNTIKTLIQSHINEHTFAKSKIEELCQEYLEVTLQEASQSASYQISPAKTYLHQKVPLNVLLYRLLLLKENKLSLQETGLPLKQGKRWSTVQPRLEEHLNTLIKLAANLGVDSTILKSQFRDNTERFVEDYLGAVEMVQTYLRNEGSYGLNGQGRETASSSALYYLSKCRTYVVYLVVR